jgi:kynurenine formamidase
MSSHRLVELSHPFTDGTVTYAGLPPPEIGVYLGRAESRAHYAAGTEFHIGRITLVGNTGTYVDSPAHRYADGADLAGVPLDRLVDLDGVVVRGTGAVGPEAFAGTTVTGRAVLIHTGWDAHWGTAAYGPGGHPYLTADGAAWLAAQGVALVGIDSVNIDDTSTGERPAHSTLLAAGIPVVEHLCGLDGLPPDGFRFHAAPPRIAGMVSFPVRAYAVLGAGR